MEPTHRLLYFDIAGKAESIRLAFVYSGSAFEDYRFKDRAEFLALQESGRFMFGQVPALEIKTGETVSVLNQSLAILRYVAKLKPESELYPSDAAVAARVDAICDQEADAFMGLRVTKYKERFGFGFLNDTDNASQLAAAQSMINSETIPRHLGTLAKQLEQGGTGWLGGPSPAFDELGRSGRDESPSRLGTAKPSIADFFWAPTLVALKDGWSGDKTVLDAFPTLLEFLKKFHDLPEITAYYEKKKDSSGGDSTDMCAVA